MQYFSYSNPMLEHINSSISEIEVCLSNLNNRFSNLDFCNMNLKRLYDYTYKLILDLYKTVDSNNSNKYILIQIKKLVKLIKSSYYDVSITFDNLDSQYENEKKKDGYMLLLKFWLDVRITGFLARTIVLSKSITNSNKYDIKVTIDE